MQLSYDEIMDILDIKYFPSDRIGYTLPPGTYETVDINRTLEYILPDKVKVTISIDDFRLKSSLKINQTLFFTGKSFFFTFPGFTQSHFHALNGINGFYHLVAGSYKSH